MSKRPLKVTGFTRFFLVMLVVAPLAYLAATYYHGQDGLKNIKDFLGIENTVEQNESVNPETTETSEVKTVNQNQPDAALEAENRRLKEELEYKTKRIEELFRENEELRRKLEAADKPGGNQSTNL